MAFEQPSLIAGFGNPIEEQDAARIAGSRAAVEKLMSDGAWRTIPQLALELRKRFGLRCADTAVSARIRDLRRKGFTVERARVKPGSGLIQYRAVKAALLALILAGIAGQMDADGGVITVRVPRAFAQRAIDEAKLDTLIRVDVIDAGNNVVNWPTRQSISELCVRLEREQ